LADILVYIQHHVALEVESSARRLERPNPAFFSTSLYCTYLTCGAWVSGELPRHGVSRKHRGGVEHYGFRGVGTTIVYSIVQAVEYSRHGQAMELA
jgi:hypothetical protein